MKTTPERTELRIVHQARSRDAKVYHLAHKDGRLKLDITEIVGGPVDGAWRVVATARERALAVDSVVEADGPTRREALRGAARAWREQELATIDWDAVEALLVEVKAL